MILTQPSLKFGDKVHLHWIDSKTLDGWVYRDPAELTELGHIETLGFVIAVSDKAVTVSSSICKNPKGVLDPMTIPYGAIEELTTI